MLRRIKGWLGIGTELPRGREITGAEMHSMMQKRIEERGARLNQAYRALYRAGELVESLGNGTTLFRTDAPPFKTEVGTQLEALGNAIKLMSSRHVTDVEPDGPLYELTLPALEVLQANRHRYNLEAGGSKTKNDAETMLMIAERLFMDAELKAEAKSVGRG